MAAAPDHSLGRSGMLRNLEQRFYFIDDAGVINVVLEKQFFNSRSWGMWICCAIRNNICSHKAREVTPKEFRIWGGEVGEGSLLLWHIEGVVVAGCSDDVRDSGDEVVRGRSALVGAGGDFFSALG